VFLGFFKGGANLEKNETTFFYSQNCVLRPRAQILKMFSQKILPKWGGPSTQSGGGHRPIARKNQKGGGIGQFSLQ